MTSPLTFGIPAPNRRLPAGAHPGAVRLQVADLARSRDYYQRLLGLTVIDAGTAGARLGPADRATVLVELVGRPGSRPVPRGGRLGLFHFAILLPDRPALGRFAAHIARERIPFGSADHAVSEALYLTDPDGLGIEVYADRDRSTWRANGRELHLTTEPLDLAGLASAGGATRWAGMPAGTVMGHVHLHVGDLARAEAFYHAALGFDKTVWNYPGALFLAAGGYHHHLGTNTWAAGAARPGEDEARLLEWELVLPAGGDVNAAGAELERQGFAIERRDAGFSVPDPWGTVVSVRCPRG